MRAALSVAMLIVTAVGAGIAGCTRPSPPPPTQVVAAQSAALPLDPDDAAWGPVPEYTARLLLQDLVEPRLMEPSTESVRVKAMSHGGDIAFRLAWSAAAPRDVSRAAEFPDACAVQLPVKAESTVPAPQMGEPGRPVAITCWRASWQATVDGRGDSIRDIYPHATVDHYPFTAAPLAEGSPAQRAMEARYAPARALDNPMAGPRKTPVEELLAAGPGTITPVRESSSRGWGKRTAEGWAVVIVRKVPAGFGAQSPSQVALAVWRGAAQESGSRKMRTGWIPLAMEVRP